MNRFRVLLASLAVLAACALPAHAGLRLEPWRGHVALGYSHVFSDSLAPAGSLSAAGGVDYPLGARWRIGPALSFNLLGSSNVTRGSLTAALDYSLFESAMLVTWLPARGPFGRLSAGPGVGFARAALSVAAGGAGFTDLAVSEVQPEFALDATICPKKASLMSGGLELGVRVLPVRQCTWTLVTARLVVHY